MSKDRSPEAQLVEWGDRLFYPGNRIVKANTPRLHWGTSRATMIRHRIEAIVRRAPQVMVKVTGGGRGMKATAAHFRYITRNGRLEIEDDRGAVEHGKEALHDIERQWRFGGAYIGDLGQRREAFNVMLSMPRGTDPESVRFAARGVREERVRRSPLCDGAARPSGPSACPPDGEGRIQARQAAQSAQGRSASLERGLRRAAARARDRR